MFGGWTGLGSAQVSVLLAALRPYLLRRLKSDVSQKLPPRVETLVECQLAPLQRQVYRALFERNFTKLQAGCNPNSFGLMTNLVMELRKCCNHPYLIRGVEKAFSARHQVRDSVPLEICFKRMHFQSRIPNPGLHT